jgi:hypothetical protein
MLDPYRNIVGKNSDAPPLKLLEPTFLEGIFRPTASQLQAIGRVATSWSIIERIISMGIARLSMAPEFPLMAVTKELTANTQLKAFGVLVDLHGERYRDQIANVELVKELGETIGKIRILKDERNVAVHTVWVKKNEDTLTSLRSKPITASKSIDSPVVEKTISELNKLADDIQKMADHLFILIQLLPSVDEARHAQSLSQEVESLHRQILPEPSLPPKSSGE